MTLIALVVAVTAGAQGTTIHEYPWNPDSNNDNIIGVDDLLDFLPVFGDEFGLPPEPCDYDGTPLEELLIGVTDGSVILDSIFIEYELEDDVSYFVIGCPEPITDTVIFNNTAMVESFSIQGAYQWTISGIDAYGHSFLFSFEPNAQTGLYQLSMYTASIVQLGFTYDGFFDGNANGAWTSPSPLPFPETWYLDENGIHIESGWGQNDWPYYANYLHILPYWHYAE